MHPPALFAISSYLGPNILLSTLFSNTLNLYPSPSVETKLHTHTTQQVSHTSLYFNLYVSDEAERQRVLR
jgi:hypothetical protein